MDRSDLLNRMAPHVRYELDKVIDFLAISNDWTGVLRPELEKLTQESILEAATMAMVSLRSERLGTLSWHQTLYQTRRFTRRDGQGQRSRVRVRSAAQGCCWSWSSAPFIVART